MIKSLQSLRFLMALMIFHHHFYTNPQIVQFGTMPVTFFFILSGFVMTIGYADKVNSDSFEYKLYLTKRLIKLLPLNAVCLALWLIIPVFRDIASGNISLSTYFLAIPDLLLVQAWAPIKEIYFSGNAVAWFLSDMFFCYLMFPVLIKMLSKKWGKVIMTLLLTVYLAAIQFVEEDTTIHAFIYISPFLRVIDFMIGIIISLMITNKITVVKRPIAGTILEILAVAIVAFAIIIHPLLPIQYSTASLYWIPATLLIIFFFVSTKWGGVLSYILSKPFLVYLGTLSFPFYMVHKIIIGWYDKVAVRIDVLKIDIVGFVFCIILTVLLSHLYVKYVEPFILSKIKTNRNG